MRQASICAAGLELQRMFCLCSPPLYLTYPQSPTGHQTTRPMHTRSVAGLLIHRVIT